MKIKFSRKEIILISCLLLLFSGLTFGAEKNVFRIEGKIEELNLWKNTLVIFEKTFVWGPSTQFFDEKGSPITEDQLKNDTRVSIESTWEKNKRNYTIQKLSILPK